MTEKKIDELRKEVKELISMVRGARIEVEDWTLDQCDKVEKLIKK